MKLIVLSPESGIISESDLICNLFDVGLELFHLRKPAQEIEEYRIILNKIPSRFHNKIIIHSHFELLDEFDLRGIHLSEKLRKENVAIHQLKKHHSRSSSFHDLNEIISCDKSYDYVFYSPVFSSISKKGHLPAKSLAYIKSVMPFVHHKVIALGGITTKNVSEVLDCNFYGIASLGFIWNSKNPVRAFEKLNTKIKMV